MYEDVTQKGSILVENGLNKLHSKLAVEPIKERRRSLSIGQSILSSSFKRKYGKH